MSASDHAESRVECQLIANAVWRVWFAELLYRSKVNHVVTSLVSYAQSILPLVEWTERLRQHSLTPDAVHRDSVVHLTCDDYRINQKVAATVGFFHRVAETYHNKTCLQFARWRSADDTYIKLSSLLILTVTWKWKKWNKNASIWSPH